MHAVYVTAPGVAAAGGGIIGGPMLSALHPVPGELAFVAWTVALVAAAAALPAVRRGFLPVAAQQHAWLAGIVLLALLWTLRSHAEVGFGLFGSALFALVFGRDRGLLGLLAAVGLYSLLADVRWSNVGVNAVLLAVVPAWLAAAFQRTLERLPCNLFVFIIGNGLFVTLLVTAMISACFVALAAFTQGAAIDTDLLAYSLLLAWGEALVSGMIFSALVVFLPDIVFTYRQDAFLPPRRKL